MTLSTQQPLPDSPGNVRVWWHDANSSTHMLPQVFASEKAARDAAKRAGLQNYIVHPE